MASRVDFVSSASAFPSRGQQQQQQQQQQRRFRSSNRVHISPAAAAASLQEAAAATAAAAAGDPARVHGITKSAAAASPLPRSENPYPAQSSQVGKTGLILGRSPPAPPWTASRFLRQSRRRRSRGIRVRHHHPSFLSPVTRDRGGGREFFYSFFGNLLLLLVPPLVLPSFFCAVAGAKNVYQFFK